MKYIIDFLILYLVTYLIYVFVINGKRKSFEKLKKNSEVMYIINRYKLDMRKVKYKRLLNTLAVINSFIIACGACIIMNVKSLILSIIITFIVVSILLYVLYYILGSYYKSKGMCE